MSFTPSNTIFATRHCRAFATLLLSLLVSQLSWAQDSADSEVNPLAGLALRNIGPAYPSGRITDFAFIGSGSHHYIAATGSGGVWETRNRGTTWTPIFDDQGSFAIGVVEVADSDQSIIWVGSGENNAQRSVAYGDGVYKSVDGGKTWKNMGLEESGHIGQIWIHPANADHVLVAAQGPLWNAGGERGLYRTEDGGQSWEQILAIDEHTGINEFVVHPNNPDLILASSYQRRRHVWTLINGGPGSGIHRSDDGGATWTRINAGLPKDNMGRIGLTMALSQPNTLYSIIEANDEEKGFYRSTDFGQHWEKRSDHQSSSPQYYNEIVADPNNADRVYSLDTYSAVSEDGGKTFNALSTAHRHVDDHALWIDPENTDHLVMGGDGGVYESWDQGQLWDHVDNLPITQFYRIQPDNDEPFYNVCGGTQDNNSLCAPSRTSVVHGITNSDWKIILGGDGYKPQIDPEDPNIIYTQYQYGGLARYDRRTQERLYITPTPPAGENNYKWNWNTPVLISPHNRTRIYYAAEKIFQSDDRGDSWRIISPDLTRQIDRNALEVMDRVWSVDAIAKNDSTSIYGSVIGLSESPLQEGLIFAGTDDGVISVTEDGGENWRSVDSFRGVPDMSLVEDIIASQHDTDVAYAVFDNHKQGDYKPYLYRTIDQGRSWRSIAGNLPERGSVHTIAEDHEDPNLLFVGTEFGLFVSQDGGDNWHQMKSNFPTIAVRDLEIQRRESDLVVGTFGRGVYILDDYSPLRTAQTELSESEATLFPVKDAWLYIEGDYWGGSGGPQANNGDNFFYGKNPEYGAVFTYYLRDGLKTQKEMRRAAEIEAEKEGDDTPYPEWEALRDEDREPDPEIILTITDSNGDVIRRVEGVSSKGLHRISWDMRLDRPDPVSLQPLSASSRGRSVGPLALPGQYAAQLSKKVGGELTSMGAAQTFRLKAMPLSPEATDDRVALQAFQQQTSQLIRAATGATRYAGELTDRLQHIEGALDRMTDSTAAQRSEIVSLVDRLANVSVALNGDRTIGSRNEPIPLSINGRLRTIRSSSWKSQAPVARVHTESFEIAESEFEEVLSELESIGNSLERLEDQLDELGAPWTPGRLPSWDSNR
ncbi:MAG: WD40/YVTN/BNR-like repeat-containing protein [Pseudohongiellaceae bacterium]